MYKILAAGDDDIVVAVQKLEALVENALDNGYALAGSHNVTYNYYWYMTQAVIKSLD